MSTHEIRIFLENFEALPHRTQFIARINDVIFVNDSKATNAMSASKALTSFSNIHWIAGGQAKIGGLEPLMNKLESVKHAYFIGECAVNFASQFHGIPQTLAKNLQNAVRQAYRNAVPGDVILLSPAAASFDAYENFEERGLHFSELVNEIDD